MSAYVGDFRAPKQVRMSMDHQIRIIEKHEQQGAEAKFGGRRPSAHIIAFETGWDVDSVQAVIDTWRRRVDAFQRANVRRRVAS